MLHIQIGSCIYIFLMFLYLLVYSINIIFYFIFCIWERAWLYDIDHIYQLKMSVHLAFVNFKYQYWKKRYIRFAEAPWVFISGRNFYMKPKNKKTNKLFLNSILTYIVKITIHQSCNFTHTRYQYTAGRQMSIVRFVFFGQT